MRNEKERFGALFRVYGAGPCRPAEFNMDLEEASACAEAVRARHSIPYHMAPGELFNRERAELFNGPGKMILEAGEEIPLY